MNTLAAQRLPILLRWIDRCDLCGACDTDQNNLLEVDRRPVRPAATSLGIGAPNLAFDLPRAKQRRSNVRRAIIIGQKPQVSYRCGQGMALASEERAVEAIYTYFGLMPN